MDETENKIIDPYTNIPYATLNDATSPETPSSSPQNFAELLDARELNVGQGGNNVLRFDKQGLWLGAKKFANAPFRVNMQGSVVATSIVLSGYTTSGDVTTIIGNTVTTGFVNALSIVAGSVDAEDITGNTITGKTLQTGTSGIRVLINASGLVGQISFFDSGNNYVGSMFGTSSALFVRGVSSIGFSIGSSGFGTVVGGFSSTGFSVSGGIYAGNDIEADSNFICNGNNGISTTVYVAHAANVGAFYELVFDGGILTSADYTP